MPKPGTAEQLRQQVLKLREDALSFSKISQKLSISKAYAVKLANAQDPLVPRPEASTPTALTVRQQRLAAELLQGKSKRQAALDAGVPAGGADSFAQRTLSNPRFRSEFGALLDQAGLSLEAIARVHAEILKATKVVAYATKDGQITDVLERPDYAVRQRAVSDGWRVHGVPEERTAQGQNYGCVILQVSAETYARLERIRGAPFPPGAIEIEPEESVDQATAAPAGSTPTEEVPVVPVGKVEKTSGVPPWPPANKVLTPDEAVKLARQRGEPETTMNMFASMKPLGLVINGAIFKQLCESSKRPLGAEDPA